MIPGNPENENIKTLVTEIIRFTINLSYKYNNNVEQLCKLMTTIIEINDKHQIFDSNEIEYIKYIFMHIQKNKVYNLKLTQENIDKILKVSNQYIVNPWILFNDFDSIGITFTHIKKTYFSDVRIGCIEDTRKEGLVSFILKWVLESKNIKLVTENEDSNGDTILHYLANGMKINLDKSTEYLHMFTRIIERGRFDILTLKNNKGWSPIDILSYVPYYTHELFYNKLTNILDILKVLYRFYNAFDGDISEHKIVVTRYFIENYYTNIIQSKKDKPNKLIYYNINIVIDLLNLLNKKLSEYPVSTISMLCKPHRDVNIYEYIHIFKKISGLYSTHDLIVDKKFPIESGDFSIKATSGKDSSMTSSAEKLKSLCLPDLDIKKYTRLFSIKVLIINYILDDLRAFKSKISSRKELVKIPANIDSKYLTYGKDYKILYNKYKQKYIALKNKLQ
jgi:hypothetical protein